MEKKKFYITILRKCLYDDTDEILNYWYNDYTFEDVVECAKGLIKQLKKCNMLNEFELIGINEVE